MFKFLQIRETPTYSANWQSEIAPRFTYQTSLESQCILYLWTQVTQYMTTYELFCCARQYYCFQTWWFFLALSFFWSSNFFNFHEWHACRLPFWPYLKLVFCMWLMLPFFNGAAYIYANIVRRYVKVGSYVSSNHSESHRKALQMMSLDARKSVEMYIEKYGEDAFDRVVKAVSILLT